MKQTAKNIFRIFVISVFISIFWSVSASRDFFFSNKKIDIPAFPDTIRPDTTLLFPVKESQNPYEKPSQGGLFLKNPSNLKQEIQYDPKNNEYTLTNKIGNIDYRRPASMSFDEYRKWDTKKALENYWRERANATAQRGRLGVIPQLRVGGELFDKIFGGNLINISPQGTAELIFGVLSNRRDDPYITPKLRRTTNFDFDMKIQMSLDARIGDRINFNTNYNTEATFDFENKLKLKYEGKEDEIIKLIEAGNVNLPLNSTLITGSQSLFGLKTQLQFGKATVTGIFSQQQSQVENITVQGGAQTQKFSKQVLDYEDNKHFFLAQYFRDNYEQALASLPVVTSNVNITKIEVWVTNIGAAITENRNIVAFQDLGERSPYNTNVHPAAMLAYPSNYANDLLGYIGAKQVRGINNVTAYLSAQKGFTQGIDFEKIESARKLNATEYTFNSKLGFISLNTMLNPDQTLAVAYQYTVLGSDSVYQVGEFSDQGIDTKSNLIIKLLKSTAVNTHIPLWNLMMKNVYNIGAYNVNKDDFILNVVYTGNDNAVPTGFFTEGPEGVKGVPLIQLLGLDRLDPQLNPPHDGIFDFIDNAARMGGTIQSSNGRVFFTVLEPFGNYLRNKINNKAIADKYCFDSLYTMTKTGAQQYPDRNKFYLQGQYKSESGSEISLNAMNVPQGSVKVTAGGVLLTEGSDYTVDYTLGRVKIINEGVLNSGTPINIKLENNSLFNVYSQTLMGAHIDYKLNNDLLLGGTILNLHERPITQKTNYGDEPISNTIWGLSLNYAKESGLITKLVDKLPFYSTKTPSKLRIDSEFAQFLPGHSRAVGKTGTSYVDDFERAKSTITLSNVGSWSLASTPQGQTSSGMFPEAAQGTGLAYGYNRALLSWYNIDATMFYDKTSSNRPKNISADELSRNSTRVIYENELFPNRENEYNQPLNINTFNLAYFPEERGPYNYDIDGSTLSQGLSAKGLLNGPNTRWGGIMRKMESSDFEANNVEYITFWLMDPFGEDPQNKGGELYFNLGDISEDILRDGRKSYENGLPSSAQVVDVDTTIWGRVPNKQAIMNSFDSKPGSRQFQDIGYDGLSSTDEQGFFNLSFLQKIINRYGSGSEAYLNSKKDPSADDFNPYAGGDMDNDPVFTSVTQRYKHFNGPEGNSPESTGLNTTTVSQRNPNVEDINNDNTLSDQERYYQYVVHLRPENMILGENYISDIYESKDIKLENKKTGGSKWYLFKIPVRKPERVIGAIQDFKSIRFMRMFFKNFDRPVICRFATLELERSEWRKYQNSLLSPGEYIPDPNQDVTSFDVSTVNIEENSGRQPIRYVLPPGIEREKNMATSNMAQMNEQSMAVKVCNLQDGDARGVFKTTDFDFRDYKNLQMYIHAEKSLIDQELKTGDITAFIRMGSDFTNNYYEYEIPLEFTAWHTSDPNTIWPANNSMDIQLSKFIELKKKRNEQLNAPGSLLSINTPFSIKDGKNKLTIVGSPSMSDVRAMMIGIRNPLQNPRMDKTDDGRPKCAEIWFNELRLTDFNEKSGWAANTRIAANLADLGNMVISGAYSSPGFGSIEKKITERQKEAVTQLDFATNLELGKFLPEKSGVRIPFHYDFSKTISNPQYNPLDPDVLYSDQMSELNRTQRDSLRNLTSDVTTRQNFNFMNVRKDRMSAEGRPQLWDIENFDASYAYSEIKHHNIDIESDVKKIYRGGIGYNFISNPKNVRPLQNIIKSKSLSLLRDFNFYYMPKVLSFRTDMNREYERRLLRNKSNAVIILEPSFTKRWDWNRLYDLKFDLTQSLKLDFTASANAYIYEPPGGYERTSSNYGQYRDTIWNSIMSFGHMNRYFQTSNLNYTLPINKIPILNWITATARYGVKYRWEASPRSLQSRFGNTIDNSQDLTLNANMQFVRLYDKFPFLRKAKDAMQARKPIAQNRNPNQNTKTKGKDQRQTAEEDNNAEEKIKGPGMGTILLNMLMSVKDANLQITRSQGMMLPGFMPEAGVLGNNWKANAPGLGFIFGNQYDIRKMAADNGWVTTDTLLNNPYQKNMVENIMFRSKLEPIRNLIIDITADRAYSNNFVAYFKAGSDKKFASTSAQERGTFNTSFFIWPTTFAKSKEDGSNPVFEKMLENRMSIAQRLAAENPNSKGQNDSTGFPNGYGPTQPEVLLHSFISAYAGRNPGKIKLHAFPAIPLPNWRIAYNLGQGMGFLSNYFQSLTISHAYRSSYSIGGFLSDINYREMDGFASALNNAGNFIPYRRLDVVMLSEDFQPFIGLDFIMRNSLMINVEYRKRRSLSLSFVNNQLTETHSNELRIGAGYRFKNVPFTVRSLSTGKKTKLTSDLNLKLDFSIRDNVVVLRRIEEKNNQISSGSKIININTSADYLISQKLKIRFFYDQNLNRPHVRAQIPTSTTNAGLSLQYIL